MNERGLHVVCIKLFISRSFLINYLKRWIQEAEHESILPFIPVYHLPRRLMLLFNYSTRVRTLKGLALGPELDNLKLDDTKINSFKHSFHLCKKNVFFINNIKKG